MKLIELTESVTFSLAEFRKDKDYPNGLYDFTPFYKHDHEPCPFCDETGKQSWPDNRGNKQWYPCDYCEGKGSTKKWIPMVGELNVANSNARAILQMLGYDDDELSGAWDPPQLPEIKRRLIKLKNTDTSEYTQDAEKYRGPARATRDENGMSRISTGPTIYDMGRTQSQVTRYVDELLKLVDAAQKLNASISWA